jgi:hypothetical protein
MELQFIQIQCVPVQNMSTTQCNVFMYGLTKDGKVFFKRDNDEYWQPESMRFHTHSNQRTQDPA